MRTDTIALRGAAQGVERPVDELTLCRRIASGEQQLFGRIIDAYAGLVAGAIAAQGVDRADVEDLAQVALVNVYRGIAGFRGEAKLSSWIYRIAVNVARGHLKRLAGRPKAQSVEEALESGQQPTDERTGVAIDTVRNRALAQALAQLSEEQRVCLSLYYFEELAYEEIAEALRMNLNTVRTHIRRGKLRLAELLEAEELDL
jgi:RNA polymerase sigma-70 factor (ECF subfamily)